MADSRKRWDTDDRFTGVADASAFASAVEELAVLAHRPGWVAEDPEIHLVPHLRGAGVDGVRIVEIRTGQDGVLAVDAECGPDASRGELRRLAWVLLGTVAEPAASVRERREGDAAIFEVVTGIPRWRRAVRQSWPHTPAHPHAGDSAIGSCRHMRYWPRQQSRPAAVAVWAPPGP